MRIILGGTVYHDLGNLNCTFFTRRSKYDRRRNLNIICNAIGNVTDLNVAVNDREDIVLGHLGRDLKISGTAAKLGKDSAYHHCTVLVDVNECVLHDALHSKAVRIQNYIKIRQNSGKRIVIIYLVSTSISREKLWKIKSSKKLVKIVCDNYSFEF